MPPLPIIIESIQPALDILNPIAVSGMAGCARLIFDNTPMTPRAVFRTLIVSVFVGVNVNIVAREYFESRGAIIISTSISALTADYILTAVIRIVQGFMVDPYTAGARLILKIFPSIENVGKVKRETVESWEKNNHDF